MLADRVRMGSGGMTVNLILYKAGDTGDDWVARGQSNQSHRLGTVTFGSSHLEWKGGTGTYDGVYTKSPIDLSKYSYLELEFSSYNKSRTTVRYDIQNINKKLYIELFIGIPWVTMHYPTISVVGWSHPSDFEGTGNMLNIRNLGEFTWKAYSSSDRSNVTLSQYIYRVELIK